jgi:hypothetical protein
MASRSPTVAAQELANEHQKEMKSTEDSKLVDESATAKSITSHRDLGILPIPKRLRYRKDKPFHFGIILNVAFGVASTFSTDFISNHPILSSSVMR